MNTEFGKKGWGTSKVVNTLQVGTRLQNGKYIIMEVYGQGPFTICYLARQNILGKKVIVNEFFLFEHCSRSPVGIVINENIRGNVYTAFKEKWLEEAILLSRCSGNENFVTVLDTFEENQTAYYVTEYINETDLQTYTLNQNVKHLEETQAIGFINQIVKGLSFLHENKIFHLNLSPVKVLVDKNNKAVIFSVGIPREHIPAEVLEDVVKLARPGYTAPELYRKREEGGALADVYSVGAILYFLLTGKDPVPAPERNSRPLPEPGKINPSVTSQTNAVVMKAMEMKPENRYPGVNDLLNDLAKVSKQPSPVRTKKILVISSVILLLVAVTAYFLISTLNKQKPGEKISAFINQKKINIKDKIARLSLNEDKTRGMTMVKDPVANDSLVLGNYFALLIGIENYKDSRYQKLSEPVGDVKSIYDVLTTNYTFETNNVIVLTDPEKKEVFEALNYYRDNLTATDNLFVFYAGHGCYDAKANMGYLIPSDADYKNDADWISFADIRKKFEVIPANHILLIADACYAGSVFRGEDIEAGQDLDEITLEQLSKKSRTAFTSAYLKPVPDRSDFLRHLITNLKNNNSRLFLSEDLYINTRNSLLRSTSKKDPVKWGVLQDCGDEGGDFIFIRRTTNKLK